jgi:LAS superfamily LD-carboxypeptidase LdcB
VARLGIPKGVDIASRKGRPVMGYAEGQPLRLRVAHIAQDHYALPEVARQITALFKAAAKKGHLLGVNSAFRTHEKQIDLFQQYGSPRAAPPGCSTHQLGISIDISGLSGDSKQAQKARAWMAQHAEQAFGFVNDADGEPWHWTYIGKPKPRSGPKIHR